MRKTVPGKPGTSRSMNATRIVGPAGSVVATRNGSNPLVMPDGVAKGRTLPVT